MSSVTEKRVASAANGVTIKKMKLDEEDEEEKLLLDEADVGKADEFSVVEESTKTDSRDNFSAALPTTITKDNLKAQCAAAIDLAQGLDVSSAICGFLGKCDSSLKITAVNYMQASTFREFIFSILDATGQAYLGYADEAFELVSAVRNKQSTGRWQALEGLATRGLIPTLMAKSLWVGGLDAAGRKECYKKYPSLEELDVTDMCANLAKNDPTPKKSGGPATPKSGPAIIKKPMSAAKSCFVCGKVGHLKAECRSFRPAPPPMRGGVGMSPMRHHTPPLPRMRPGSFGPDYCTGCLMTGHSVATCRTQCRKCGLIGHRESSFTCPRFTR